MAGWAAPVTVGATVGSGPAAPASTTAPSTKSSSKAALTARVNRIVEMPAVAATNSPQAASMHIMMASQADLQSPFRLSMPATLLVTIGVGARVMITRTARLARYISISRQGPQGQMDRQLSGRMGRHGTVSKALMMYTLYRVLIDTDGGQIVYYRSTACPQTLTSSYKSSCTC